MRGSGRTGLLVYVIVVLVTLLAGLWLVLRGNSVFQFPDFLGGSGGRGLQLALFQTAPLRTAQGGTDRIYAMSTQSQTVYFGTRRGSTQVRREYLHVDLWAIDAATAQVAWRNRLRTFEEGEIGGQILPGFEILGADGTTLWLNVSGPLGVSLADGQVVADAASVEQRNPQLAGKLVIERGYIAFGRNGLQLTLSDASQWRIDAADLSAAPRDTPVSRPSEIAGPGSNRTSATSSFQVRALPIGERWLGLLTDAEADHLGRPPVVPGRSPDDRPGALQQYLEANHVPPPLHDPLPQPYRLWGARMQMISAAPMDWPKDFPDNWGKRPQFSNYELLPESPSFLRAGLLREHGDADVPIWYRDPDSVLVLHVDKLGQAGRLQLTRVSGPRGSVVWGTPLPFVSIGSVMRGAEDLCLWGSEPESPGSASAETYPEHRKLVRIDVASGHLSALDLSAESMIRDATPLREQTPPR